MNELETLQIQIKKLEAENKLLKDKVDAYEDERKCLSKTITCDANVIYNLNKENAKLKCLVLHLFGHLGFYASEWYSDLDEERRTTRRAVKWWKIHLSCKEAYRKAKKELMDNHNKL